MKKEIKNQDLNNVSGGVVMKEDKTGCPKCCSTNIAKTTNGCSQTTYTCQDCGHTWNN